MAAPLVAAQPTSPASSKPARIMLIFFMLVSRALIGLSPFRAIRAQHRGVLSLRVGAIPPVDPVNGPIDGARIERNLDPAVRRVAIALIDDVDVIERILKHLKVGHPRIENRSPAGPEVRPVGLGVVLPVCR
jgi:hypothetical protein